MSWTSMLGDGVGFGLDLWNKNNQYQLEKKKLEYQAAQERAKEQTAAAKAAQSAVDAARQLQLSTWIRWGAILVISLVGGNMIYRFLSHQLKGA